MKKIAIPIFVSVIVVYVSFALLVVPIGKIGSLDIGARGQLGDTFGALNALFSSLGFAGILLTLYLQNKDLAAQSKNNEEEVAERRSLFNLDASIQAYTNAVELLQDGNGNRATWIRAARIIQHGNQLSASVTVDAHKIALELRLLDFRSRFRDIINQPATFFYGSDIPFLLLDDMDEAARVSSSPDAAHPGHEITAMRWIDEKSLLVVLEASQWPQDYDDPLQLEMPNATELERKTFFARGVRQYLEHRQLWDTHAGVLRPRTRHGINAAG